MILQRLDEKIILKTFCQLHCYYPCQRDKPFKLNEYCKFELIHNAFVTTNLKRSLFSKTTRSKNALQDVIKKKAYIQFSRCQVSYNFRNQYSLYSFNSFLESIRIICTYISLIKILIRSYVERYKNLNILQ
jgi:hypothetical protein